MAAAIGRGTGEVKQLAAGSARRYVGTGRKFGRPQSEGMAADALANQILHSQP